MGRRNLSTVILLIAALTGQAWAEFQVDDQIVSAPGSQIVDPEFDSVNNRMVWQDAAGNVWLAALNPMTGDVFPPDGRGLQIASNAAMIKTSHNGPEWTYEHGQPYVSFTKQFFDTTQIAVVRNTGTWSETVLRRSIGRVQPGGVASTNQDMGRLVYGHLDQDAISWRVGDKEKDEKTLMGATSLTGRWIEGERRFLYFARVGNYSQLFEAIIDTGETRQITTGSADSNQAQSWYAPEFRESIFVSALNSTHLAFYRRILGEWRLFNNFRLPSVKAFVNSPEGFSWNGKSYVVVVATNTRTGNPADTSQIWLAGIDPDTPFFRRLDDPETSHIRSDPEVYITADGPVAFYSERDLNTGEWRLRRAATGLGPAQQAVNLVTTNLALDSTPVIGETLTFEVSVQNSGDLAATGVKLFGILPQGLAFVHASPSCLYLDKLVCSLENIVPGESVVVAVDALVIAGGHYLTQMKAVAAETESTLADNVSRVETDVPGGPAPNQYALNVAYFGGQGRIVSEPAGIDCPGTCTAWFDNGSEVVLTAEPGLGQSFVKWFDACLLATSNPACSVIMNNDNWASAMFATP